MNIKRSYDIRVDRAENNAFVIRAYGLAVVTQLETQSTGILGSGGSSRQYVNSQSLQTETLHFAFTPEDEMRDPFTQIYSRLDKEIDKLVASVFGTTPAKTSETAPVKRGRGRPRKEAK